jgi:cobaltochelatase CobT
MKLTWPWQRQHASGEYKIYTTKYDVVCSGADLTRSISPSQRLHWDEACAHYDNEVEPYRIAAAIDGAKYLDDLSKEERFQPAQTAVTVLVDHSGSIKGQRAVIAILAVEVIADLLSRSGVAFEILGFTTQSWRGGRSRQDWIAAGRPPNPGRLADTLHIVYRKASDTAPGVSYAVRHLLRSDLLKENIDGEAVFWAGQRLMELDRPNNLLLTISDGAPVDDSTLAANHPLILWDHLKSVIVDLRQTPGFRVAGIGIDHDPKGLYPAHIRIDRLDALADKLLPFVISELAPRN